MQIKNKENDNLYIEICKKIEKINLTVENYEDILDIICELNLYINKIKISLNKEEPQVIKKDDTINVGLLKTDFIYSMRKRLRPFLLIDKIIR